MNSEPRTFRYGGITGDEDDETDWKSDRRGGAECGAHRAGRAEWRTGIVPAGLGVQGIGADRYADSGRGDVEGGERRDCRHADVARWRMAAAAVWLSGRAGRRQLQV